MTLTEYDLRETVDPFNAGPGKLATPLLLSPLSGFEVIQGLQPFLSLSTHISFSETLTEDLLLK